MKLISSLWLLLATLVGVSVQQCTIEKFEMIELDLVRGTLSDGNLMITAINDTVYNCLSTSQTIGEYKSMSVSIFYTRSDNLTNLRQVRFNMICTSDNGWEQFGQQSTAFRSNDTRQDCFDCTNQTVNEYHCTR